MRSWHLVLLGLVVLCGFGSRHAEAEEPPAADLAAWAVGRWETADVKGNPWLWLEFHTDGRHRLGAVHHWMDATYRVEGEKLFTHVTAGKKGPQDEVEARITRKDDTLGLGPPEGPPAMTYTRLGRPAEADSLKGVWKHASPEGTRFLRFTASGTMHGRTPQEASEGRYRVEGGVLLLTDPVSGQDGEEMEVRRDGSLLVTGTESAPVRFRRLDVPWYRVPGEEPAPHPVGSWMHVKDGELEGWTFVFDADGRVSVGIAHQEGFSGILGQWRWEDDVVVMGEAREPGAGDPSAASADADETMCLRVKPLDDDDDAMEVHWQEPMGEPGEAGWRYERTSCPKALIRVWETAAEGATHVLDLRAHHDFEFRTSRPGTGEDEVRRGEWHAWRDQLWLTFPESGGFGQWRIEQPSPDELHLTSRGGRTITYHRKIP